MIPTDPKIPILDIQQLCLILILENLVLIFLWLVMVPNIKPSNKLHVQMVNHDLTIEPLVNQGGPAH